ncbi:hypothetical protein Tco_0217163 [Tanacetum coccineum]
MAIVKFHCPFTGLNGCNDGGGNGLSRAYLIKHLREVHCSGDAQAITKHALLSDLVVYERAELTLKRIGIWLCGANEIHEKDEKLKRYRRIGMKAVKEKEQLQKTIDSWKESSKNLWRLINSGMSSNDKLGLGYEIQSNDEVLSYKEEINFSVFKCSKEDSIGKPLYSCWEIDCNRLNTGSIIVKSGSNSDQEAQILAYSQAVKKLEAQLVTFQKQQLSLNEKLTFEANKIHEKDEKLKRYRRIGMKAVKEKEQLQKTIDSWKESSRTFGD